ncbi:MAG: FHA domain-containing protein [Labilithrix sp.]|nr:FHA domain-containing protein [Labilithrix sp.]MBX3224878.1 FHA domain-containing protein [Labilithrix sp.]
MVSLVMNPGLPEEQQFTLSEGTVTIGRTKDNAVFCLHKSLSRKHAQVDFDGVKVKITDLQSKNGIFVNGKRVSRCELFEGDSFRCGDITFLLEGTTTRSTKVSNQGAFHQDRAAQTLPSPFAIDPSVARRPTVHATPNVTVADDQRYKDKLFLLIRASELCVSELSIDRVLDELIALAVQVLEVDRIALLALDDATLDMRPRVIRTFVAPHQYPYSTRVVDWVVDHGSPASFADVSRDRTLPGELARDASVRGAMCVPINPGGGTIGVIYADSLSRADCFRPDDLALLRALANLAAVAIESAALRNSERQTVVSR